jgi:hypothetical protein
VPPVGPDAPPFASFEAVSGGSSTDVWFVGAGLRARWDGTGWRNVRLAPYAWDEPYSTLTSVVAFPSGGAMAVGYRTGRGGQSTRAIALRFDGSRWSGVPVPQPWSTQKYSHFLTSVRGRSPDDLWAVGSASGGPWGDVEAFVTRWDGSDWSNIPTGFRDYLRDVTVVRDGGVWILGSAVYRYTPCLSS